MFKKLFAVLAVAAGLVSSAAFAAVPTGVDTAITAAQTDATTIGGYILIAIAGLVAVGWMIKMLSKR